MEELIKVLRDVLPRLMSYYTSNPDGSDYKCCFCNNYEDRNGIINHDKDCEGEKIYKLIKDL
jgi:hypothetical protein